MKSIGGFIGMEKKFESGGLFHSTYALTTGRASLLLILKKIGATHVYIPHHTCGIIKRVLATIPHSFYSIDKELKIEKKINLHANTDFILYTNYFGLMSDYIMKLREEYGDRVIVDDCQAFYSKGYDQLWSFNSARKFFGVTDGSYLYSPVPIDVSKYSRAQVSTEHLFNASYGNQDLAYKQFIQRENSMDYEIERISQVGHDILKGINYIKVQEIRRNNFLVLHKEFKKENRLDIKLGDQEAPMYYPLWTNKSLHSKLISQRLFVPMFWRESIKEYRNSDKLTQDLTLNLIPLPIDQRYDRGDMIEIIRRVNKSLYG